MSLPSAVAPMAAQMARLLAGSDLDELREIVRRWVAVARPGGSRRLYESCGARLGELKTALADAPVAPTIEELENALTIMLRRAALGGEPPPAR